MATMEIKCILVVLLINQCLVEILISSRYVRTRSNAAITTDILISCIY